MNYAYISRPVNPNWHSEIIGARDHADTTGRNTTVPGCMVGDCYRGKCTQGAEAPQIRS